jgi:hypothetical protein
VSFPVLLSFHQESLVLEDKPDLQKMYKSINGILASVLKICNDFMMAATLKPMHVVGYVQDISFVFFLTVYLL